MICTACLHEECVHELAPQPQLSLGGVLAQRAHDGAELLGGDGAPSLSNREKASLNSAICSSVRLSAMVVVGVVGLQGRHPAGLELLTRRCPRAAGPVMKEEERIQTKTRERWRHGVEHSSSSRAWTGMCACARVVAWRARRSRQPFRPTCFDL